MKSIKKKEWKVSKKFNMNHAWRKLHMKIYRNSESGLEKFRKQKIYLPVFPFVILFLIILVWSPANMLFESWSIEFCCVFKVWMEFERWFSKWRIILSSTKRDDGTVNLFKIVFVFPMSVKRWRKGKKR